jgi:hypothetical protein
VAIKIKLGSCVMLEQREIEVLEPGADGGSFESSLAKAARENELRGCRNAWALLRQDAERPARAGPKERILPFLPRLSQLRKESPAPCRSRRLTSP